MQALFGHIWFYPEKFVWGQLEKVIVTKQHFSENNNELLYVDFLIYTVDIVGRFIVLSKVSKSLYPHNFY